MSTYDPIDAAKKTVLAVLRGEQTYDNARFLFDEDVLYDCIRDLEKSAIDWLITELARPEYPYNLKTMVFWSLMGGDSRARAAKAIGSDELAEVGAADTLEGLWRPTGKAQVGEDRGEQRREEVAADELPAKTIAPSAESAANRSPKPS